MAKKLLMNKVNNVIDNYNRWLQVFEFSKSFNIINDSRIDEEGKLYIDEIWGNTWQDNGSKNLFDKNQEITVGLLLGNGVIDTNPNRVDYSTSDYIQIKPLTTYAIRLGTFDNRVGFYDKDKEFIDIDTFRNSNTFTTPQNCVYIRTSCLHMFENVQLNEGSVLLEYDEYRKSDLSNIQHVGELYVDEEGKKQYKIDINVNNGVLWEGEYNCRVDPNWATSDLNDGIGGYGASDYIEIEGGIILEQTWRIHMFFFDKDKKGISNTKDRIFTTPKNTKYVRMAEHNCYGQKTDALLRIKGVDDTVKKSHQQTILLPCQLMKVGDVKDRLYWDVDKGRYMVEKNIDVKKITSARGYFFNYPYQNRYDNIYLWQVHCNGKKIMSKNGENGIFHNPIMSLAIEGFTDNITALIKQSKFNELGYNNTEEDVIKFLTENDSRVVFQVKNPELIETNITKRIELPCYNPITHVMVNSGNVEPNNIKVLVPMKTLNAPIMDGLICWLESNDLSGLNTIKNGTVWKNRVKNGSNAIIRTIDGSNVDGVKNGLFRTHCKTYVELPSFETNNNVGMSIFVDGVINKRPSHEYNRVYTLQYNDYYTSGISLNYGYSDFGYTRCFTTNYRSLFDRGLAGPYPIPFSVASSTRIGIGFLNNVKYNYGAIPSYNNTFNNNFLNVESPTSDIGDISYGLVLIYNRDLSEEEMRQNYEYSTSIQRGDN